MRSDRAFAEGQVPAAGTDSRAARQKANGRRLLIVSAHFPPHRGAATHRILRFARHLDEFGWNVHVLTMDPASYRAGTTTDENLTTKIPAGVCTHRTQVLRGLTTLRRLKPRRASPASEAEGIGATGARNGTRTSRFQQLKDAVSDLFSLPDPDIGWLGHAVFAGARIVRKHDIPLVLSSAPPFTCHLVAAALQRVLEVKWVADFRDPWSRAPWTLAERTRSWKGTVHRRLERYTVRAADVVLLNTDRMREEFAAFYGPGVARKFQTLTNGFDADIVRPYAGAPTQESRPLVFIHAGTLYGERSPTMLLEGLAAAIHGGCVPASDIRLELVGAISPRFPVQQMIDRLGIHGAVSITGPLPHAETLSRISRAHVLVVVQPGTHLQVPAKLYEYMAFRKPLLALAPPGAVADLLEQGRLGLVVSPDDAGGISNAFCTLYQQGSGAMRLLSGSDDYVARFEGRVLTQQLEQILLDLL
jgi:glycosyltransferase involved in cell wall biosynthesis